MVAYFPAFNWLLRVGSRTNGIRREALLQVASERSVPRMRTELLVCGAQHLGHCLGTTSPHPRHNRSHQIHSRSHLDLLTMAAFAPPVQRDEFLYSSGWSAEAGNNDRHPRASVTELTALLRPEVAQSKRAKMAIASSSSTDPPWHFWTAQLIHYGLQPTKDKNAAKIRLLSALNGDKLQVPGWITRLEMEMKKEWRPRTRS